MDAGADPSPSRRGMEETDATAPNGTAKRRRWSCTCACAKEDFFPEESFRSWAHYMKALASTRSRLCDRLTARSADAAELIEMRARSNHEMRRDLDWRDLICFGIGAVIGAGIFVLTGLEARDVAGPAVVLSYVVSGLSAMLSVFCYTEFAVDIPVAGGSFAYLRVELGDFVAFIAAGNILIEYIVSGAALARAWSSYLATLFNQHPDYFRIAAPRLAEDYNKLDLIAVAVITAVSFLAVVSTKFSSRFNLVATILHVVILAFIVVAGLARAKANNYRPFTPYGVRGVFKASAVLFFAYVGFDAVSTMAEETKNPAKDIPIGLVGSMSITTLVYCLLAVTLCLMQPYADIDVNAPFSVAFQGVGMGWAKYIVALGALKGMTTVLLTTAVGQARYLTHIARTHMVPPWLAAVSERFGTPVRATVVMAAASALVALFTELNVLANLLSISTLFIFSLVALALLVRRYYSAEGTTDADRNKLVGFVVMILASSVVTAVYWAVGAGGWQMYAVTVPIWFISTLGLRLYLKEVRKPTVWGVPLVPWLPSASIGVNVFLMGSIDGKSYMRFGVWTLVLLVYYLLFGLHASYDAAKECGREADVREPNDVGEANTSMDLPDSGDQQRTQD